MAALPIYETQKGFNRQALHAVDVEFVLGNLTDAIINPLTTVAGLRAILHTNAYETNLRRLEQFRRWVDFAEAIGVLTDARVAAADTVDGLKTLFTDEDTTITATGNYSNVA